MALRIGPVGPVREAGLGSGAGLGSEALSCAVTGDAVYPMAPEPSVSAHPQRLPFPGGGDPFQMRPRVALSYQARRCDGAVVRVRKGERLGENSTSVGPSKPRRGAPVRSRSHRIARYKAGVARQCASGDPSAGFTQRRSRGEMQHCGVGSTARRAEGPLVVVAALALSPLVPRARTGVSPTLPWNALGCVGAGAPALSIAGIPVR